MSVFREPGGGRSVDDSTERLTGFGRELEAISRRLERESKMRAARRRVYAVIVVAILALAGCVAALAVGEDEPSIWVYPTSALALASVLHVVWALDTRCDQDLAERRLASSARLLSVALIFGLLTAWTSF